MKSQHASRAAARLRHRLREFQPAREWRVFRPPSSPGVLRILYLNNSGAWEPRAYWQIDARGRISCEVVLGPYRAAWKHNFYAPVSRDFERFDLEMVRLSRQPASTVDWGLYGLRLPKKRRIRHGEPWKRRVEEDEVETADAPGGIVLGDDEPDDKPGPALK